MALEEIAHDEVPGQGHTARWTALAVGVVMVALIGVFAASQFGEDTIEANPVIGSVAPPVVGETIDGGTYDLDRFRGQWVVVNFFATWCIPCRVEHPELVEFDERHDGDGVSVVSVAFDDSPDEIAAFFAEEGGDWPVIPSDTGRVVLDYGVTGVPESYLVAPSGQVVAGFQGVTADVLDDTIAGFEAQTTEPTS